MVKSPQVDIVEDSDSEMDVDEAGDNDIEVCSVFFK